MILSRLAKSALAPRVAHAHCDIPCGIYDPYAAQIAALTCIRMNQLIQGLKKPAANAPDQEREVYMASLGRYIAAKEEHAELCKREIRVIWGDYFRPEHIQANPTLHDKVFQVMKQGSRVRQNVDAQAAQDLLKAVQDVAEIFWATKNVKTTRKPSNQAVGGELVVPA
ncbi:MAG: superoxide dismutase, Ni [Chloroflexi bacterium]|nr:superoxide dismutase, Ni [Chloroflexota bacterium]